MPDKKEIIERLCKSAWDVAEQVYGSENTADCLCVESNTSSFRFEEEVIKFIEDAVKEKINKTHPN